MLAIALDVFTNSPQQVDNESVPVQLPGAVTILFSYLNVAELVTLAGIFPTQ